MAGRILVIRGGAIGDFVLTLPAIHLLRDNFPETHLEILGYKHIIALAEDRFYANATRSIEYAALSSFFVPMGELPPELVAYFGSFQQIVSYLYDPDGFFENNVRRCGVKHFLHVPPKLDDSDHATRQLARPLERLALYLDQPSARLYPSAADRDAAAEFLRDARRPVIALHPGSGSESKNWPLENWIDLGLRLGATATFILVAGEADRERADACRKAWRDLPALLAQDMPLPHLAAVLAECDLFIGHDTGISHIAAAAGTRCVLLFGPSDRDIWAPKNDGVTVIAAENGELARTTSDMVESAVQTALARP